MNLMMYVYKRNFDVQKAERFFKERKVKCQIVDMKKNPPGRRELELFERKVGLNQLIDQQNKAYLEHPIRFMATQGCKLDALVDNPQLLAVPIVRDGQNVTVGYQPDVWSEWLKG